MIIVLERPAVESSPGKERAGGSRGSLGGCCRSPEKLVKLHGRGEGVEEGSASEMRQGWSPVHYLKEILWFAQYSAAMN